MKEVIDYIENNSEKILVKKGDYCHLVLGAMCLAIHENASVAELGQIFDQFMEGQSISTRKEFTNIMKAYIDALEREIGESDE